MGKIPLYHRLQGRLLDRVSRLGMAMSPFQRKKAGRLLAGLARDIMGIRVNYVKTALSEHLGISTHDAELLCKKIYDRFFENAIEMAGISHMTGEQVAQYMTAEGLEHLKAAHSMGKGVIIVSGHYGLWEFVPPWLALNGFPMTVVVRRQRNKAVDQWFEQMRRKHGANTTDSGFGIRDIFKTLKQGRLVGLMSDQDAGDRAIFVEFLGKTASVPIGPALISLKTGSPIVMAAAHRSEAGPPHRIEFFEPILPGDFPQNPDGMKAIAQKYTSIIEGWVKTRPEQWFWLHRRWKTRPPREID